MYSHVYPEITSRGKDLATNCTLARVWSKVVFMANVYFHVILCGEELVAMFTLVWSAIVML